MTLTPPSRHRGSIDGRRRSLATPFRLGRIPGRNATQNWRASLVRAGAYCLDRFTLPKLVGLRGAEHKNRADAAVSLLSVTTTFVSEN